ncbi:MAG: ABC transporter ATP-binding protein/permease [Treponema sp.]|jgi:ABC-type multidrug transport system fused ATPase/permease subunit|nr:ABC transporter ATP-binding protein/permease [Treponema sp.]
MKLKLILSLLIEREKRQLIFVLFVLFIMGCIELVGIGSIGPFISIVSNPQIIHTNVYIDKVYTYFNFASDKNFIIASGITVIIVLALSNFFLSCVNFIIYYYSAKRRHSIAMRLLEKYLRQPYIFYLNVNTAELSRNILGDVSTFVSSELINLLHLISSAIIAISIVILLVIVNPLLALVISAVLGLAYIIIFSIIRKFLARKGVERSIQNTLKYKYINETFGGIKDIKILGKEQVFLNFFFGPSKKFAMNDAISEVVNDLPKYMIETLAIGGIVGVIIMMIHSGAQIDEFLPVLTVYAFGAYRLLPLLQKIFRAVASIKYNFPIVENLNRDFRELPEGLVLTNEDTPRLAFRGSITLEHIVFSYPNTNKDIIKNQSITIASNTSVALVGSTGCGKTTLVDILLGLLEPQSGKIYIDNQEINDTNRKNWQKNLGYVPQSIYLTDDTIRHNIAFGIDPKKIDDAAIIRAAQLANIHRFIVDELKNGYDTIIGERGIRLSGGQRQRIGIARAVYHDPSVLILDEATSALDSLTENAIMDAIKNLSHKKTIIMIAHRITTVKNCDMIYLMDKGIIVDYGDYETLYHKNAAFRKMADGV